MVSFRKYKSLLVEQMSSDTQGNTTGSIFWEEVMEENRMIKFYIQVLSDLVT